MTLGEKLKSLRTTSGLSQEAIGAQGFVSTPGWIKIENGQRSPSEKLIEKLVDWLVAEKHVRASAVRELRMELLTLKYMDSHSPFLKNLAHSHATGLPRGAALLIPKATAKPVRGRPKLVAAR